ncbi:MAG: energy-coupling factor transporter transmembrane component T family protein [Candidatus Dormibacterales bacterium]
MPGTVSLYVEAGSPLHRAHPLTKVTLALSAIALGFILPFPLWVAGVEVALLSLVVAGRVVRRLVVLAAVLIAPLAVLLLLVQGLVNPANRTILVALGPIPFYLEGLKVAAVSLLRIACLVTATFLFSTTTRPADLAEALMQKGLSARIGYVIQATLQVIPEMLSAADRIRDAQRARGLETEGGLVLRARAYIPLLAPLVLSSLVSTQERAMALEVRGFGLKVPRPARYVLADSAWQRAVRWLLVLAVPAALAVRILAR